METKGAPVPDLSNRNTGMNSDRRNNTTIATRLLRAQEAAEQLAISQRKLWEITNTGELKSIKIGRAVRYHPDDLADFIAKHRGRRGAR